MPALAGVLLVFWLGIRSNAKFLAPRFTPVDRLLANAEGYLARNPGEADAHYTVARIHYLAFSLQRDQIPTLLRGEHEEGKPRMPPQWMIGAGPGRVNPIRPR